MNRPFRLTGAVAAATAIVVVWLSALCVPAVASEMTFQLINDSERSLNLKLFSRSDSRQQWPSKTKAFSVKPDAARQAIKITCEEGEQICWGAWMTVQNVSGEVGSSGARATHTTKFTFGAGERGQRSCERCCHICKDGAITPVIKMRDPDPGAQ